MKMNEEKCGTCKHYSILQEILSYRGRPMKKGIAPCNHCTRFTCCTDNHEPVEESIEPKRDNE
ncbi:hypothetical protein LCGC14_1229260 [marine sediment metagenome]|uniref:Uncharacterized protein n=1 Tax=marine sediment metagenome TaxID=412755 RepID=A0A0F9NRB8_9ZZZZ